MPNLTDITKIGIIKPAWCENYKTQMPLSPDIKNSHANVILVSKFYNRIRLKIIANISEIADAIVLW